MLGWLPPLLHMDPSGFPFPWDKDQPRQQPSSATPVTGASHPERELQPTSQPRIYLQESVATPADPIFRFPQPGFPEYPQHGPQFNRFPGSPQPFLTPIPAINNLFARIINHPAIATHSNTLYHYLQLPPSLWAELYKPNERFVQHRQLTHYLSQLYGRLPDDLWALLEELREQPDFLHARNRMAATVLEIAQRQNPPQTPPASTGLNMGLLGNDGFGSSAGQSLEASPVLVQVFSPTPGQPGRAAAPNPFSVDSSRSTSQNRKSKGRAPLGERYKCPYTNCKHEPFRNSGNFQNHMRGVHAESPYRHRHPSEFLIPDVSPQASVQGDGTSSAATNASESPVDVRRPSQDCVSGDLTGAVARDRFGSADDGIRRSGLLNQMGSSALQENFGSQESHRGSEAGEKEAGSLLGGFGFGLTGRDGHMRIAERKGEFAPGHEEPVGFEQFQLMEEQRWSERMER